MTTPVKKPDVARIVGFIVTFLLFIGGVTTTQKRVTAIVVNCLLFPALLYVFSGRAGSVPSKRVIRWIGLTVVAGVICLGLGIYEIPAASTVTVTPSDVTFQGQWMTHTFSVTNGLDKPVYTVTVKFAYGVPPEDFKFEAPLASKAPRIQLLLVGAR
jgi:hypothetical protein